VTSGVLARDGDQFEDGEYGSAGSGSMAWWLIWRPTYNLLVIEGADLPVPGGLMRRCDSPTVRRRFGDRATPSYGLQVIEALSLLARQLWSWLRWRALHHR
jgi:hypothetical protein